MIATFDWFGYELLADERYRLIKQTGFDGVLLWWDDEFGDGSFRTNPEQARRAGLTVLNAHAPFDRINEIWFDTPAGEDVMRDYLRTVDECAQYGIPTVVMHPTSGRNPPPCSPTGLARWERVVERAEQKNVNVAFENMRHPAYLVEILKWIDSPRAGVCFDSGHEHCWGAGYDILAQYGTRLTALHLDDNDGTRDAHLLPFDGTIDWDRVLAGLAASAYRGMTVLEAENGGYEQARAEDFLLLAAERARTLEQRWNRLRAGVQ